MKHRAIIVAALLIAPAALAQQAAPPIMSAEQRLASQVAVLSMQNAEGATQLETVQQQVAQLQKQITDLRAKCGEPCKSN